MAKALSVVGVVGAGAMGRGIAQVCAMAGCSVQLFDMSDGAASRAISLMRDDLMQAVAKGKASAEDVVAALQKITAVTTMHAMSTCDLVVEAIVEQLEPKQKVLTDLESIVEPTCVLATNTSSLSVTEIAAACVTPGRVVGWHFFNPVPRMKLVEVIRAPRTTPETVQALVNLSVRVGHRAIVVSDSPGFVVNHAGRAFVTEGLKLLAECTADYYVLDEILRTCGGFRMGPFELLDLTGLDVSVPVMESIHSQFYGDDRYRPVTLARTRMLAGLLGRKTGQGFYDYENKNSTREIESSHDQHLTGSAVWWLTDGAAAVPDSISALLNDAKRARDISEADVILVAPIGGDVSSVVTDLQLDPGKVVGVDRVFGSAAGMTLMVCPGTAAATVAAARAVFAAQAVPTFVIADSPGFVAPRVVACIVNLACEMAQQGISSPADIDIAVRLGLGYPAGPFEWGDRLGPKLVLAILEGLYATFGDQRYRPSPWLVRRAKLSLPLSAPDRIAQPTSVPS
ncbi:3-hydroxyacyl-CoA dehydrogenase [Caballeronia novacaledonica]|uniref:3-hydroxyacyl-CoA dehydrogenase n=1 Tax=Caballeronia novacaledonica TaxID=1544861 RepID=A0AA37MT78_9BURK|nr:3-hydroxyacyl-CoA dehydrogenase [Caballeronia novacaledonica]GJH27029.1 3-hydroxyacyl-CoA dehydrogenase [Caballeronia novacaledonica]